MIEHWVRSSKLCIHVPQSSGRTSSWRISPQGRCFLSKGLSRRNVWKQACMEQLVLMDPRYIAIVSAAVIIILGGAVFLVRTFVRGWLMPACWRCGAHKVRKSRADSFMDTAAVLVLLHPFRCTGCRSRFYAPSFMAYRPAVKRSPVNRPRPSQAPAQAHLPATSLQSQNPA